MPLKSWSRVFAALTALLAGGAVILGVCALLGAVSLRSLVIVGAAALVAGGLWRASLAQRD